METRAAAKGQIVIPSKNRSKLGTKERIRIQREKLKGKGLTKALMAEKKKEREL
jgi:bifunctional DNA-binding transcriptional regulator/antitoxin component of YhaV-PrlF toxin-antitoxin module